MMSWKLSWGSHVQGGLHTIDQVLLPPFLAQPQLAPDPNEDVSSRTGSDLPSEFPAVSFSNFRTRKLRGANQTFPHYTSLDEAMDAVGLLTSKSMIDFIGGYPTIQDPSFKVRV
jgi:hypothetical protein